MTDDSTSLAVLPTAEDTAEGTVAPAVTKPRSMPTHTETLIAEGMDPWEAFAEWEDWLDRRVIHYMTTYDGDPAGRDAYVAETCAILVNSQRENLASWRAYQTRLDHDRARQLAADAAHDAAERALAEERARLEREQMEAVFRALRERAAIATAEQAAQAAERRREADETRRLQLAGLAPLPAGWWGHLVWLQRTFGDRAFSAAQACDAAHDDPDAVMPPGITASAPGAPRQLGTAYAANARRDYDGAWIEPGAVSHGVRRWTVTVKTGRP